MPRFHVNIQPKPFAYMVASINDEDYVISSGITHVIYRSLTETRTVTLPDPAVNFNRLISIVNNASSTLTVSGMIKAADEEESIVTTVNAGYAIEVISDGADWVLTKQVSNGLYL